MNSFVLKTQRSSDGGLIEMYPPKSPAEWRFDEGESLIKEFPRGAAVQFSDNWPDNRMDSLEKDQIGRIKKLAINEKGIRPDAKMFRCTKQRRLVLINEEVHDAFKKAGLTGFKVYKAEGWNGLEL